MPVFSTVPKADNGSFALLQNTSDGSANLMKQQQK